MDPQPQGSARRVAAWLRDVRDDEAAVVLRQVPFVVVFTAACLVWAALGEPPSSATAIGVAVVAALASLVMAVALPWRRLPVRARLALQVLHFLAAGALWWGTGAAGSVVTALLLVPVVTAASEPGRRGVVLAVAAPTLIVAAPLATTDRGGVAPRDAVGVLLVTLVALAMSLVINGLSERLRARSRAAHALRTTGARLLAESQRDTDELARRTEEVRRARDLFASVIEAATEQAIIGTDVHGVIEVFNPGAERLVGVPAGEVVRRARITELHDPVELAGRRDELVQAAGGGAGGEGLFGALVAAAWGGGSEVRDWTYVRGDGSRVVVRVAVTRRLDRDGVTNGYIFVATDMTAEREAARLKDEFVSLISHELRTPLSSILGYLELTVDAGELSVEQRGYVAVIERNANRLLRLVGDLLFTAQVEAGQFALVRAPVDVAASVAGAVQSARPAAVAAGVELVVRGCQGPVVVAGDGARLGQAWDNLISNAVKFTGAGGQVVVELVQVPGGVQVSVSDTGTGIGAGDLDRLFGRFFRAQSATRNAVPGVGLGLTITRAIIDAHGGDLQVRSTLGQGTTFTATLPHDT